MHHLKFNETHSDKILVEALQAGSEKAFEELYNKYANKIYNITRKMNVEKEEAENVVQDVFLKIWRNRINLDSQLSFTAYLITIAKSIIIKQTQQRARFMAYQNYSLHVEPQASNSTEEYVIFKELEDVSNKAYSTLPARQQQVYLMKNSEYLTTDEITQKLGVSKRTVENQLYRATKALKEKLGKAGFLSLLFILFLVGVN